MRNLSLSLRFFAPFAVIVLVLALLATPGYALAQEETPQPTPTAGEDGRILYTVQPGDSQFAIAARFGIDLPTLQTLNNWTGDEILQEGQVILLGLASDQPEPSPTPAPEENVVATVTSEAPPAEAGTGTICVLLFDDVNGDAMRSETEFGIAGGQASINERTGLASQSAATVADLDDEGEPQRTCFENLPLGEYTISVAIPDGYNPTTAPNITIQIAAGQTQDINFGAQMSTEGGFDLLSPEEGGRSPLMGLLGVVLLLAGAGLGFFTLRMGRRR